MALSNNVDKIIFLNINKGHFVKSLNKDETYKRLTGTITSVYFKKDYFKTVEYDLAMFGLQDGDEKYVLCIKCHTSYFRALCNSIASGDIHQPFTFEPSYNERDNKATVFVSQAGKTLKWKYTVDNPGDMPLTERIEVGDKIVYDSSKQWKFWMDWCKKQKFSHE